MRRPKASGHGGGCCDDNVVKVGRRVSPGGINWIAVVFLLLFCLPVCFTGFITVYDWMYPTRPESQAAHKTLVNCYTVANPSNLAKVSDLVKKYEGKEHKLLAKLKERYPKIPECSF